MSEKLTVDLLASRVGMNINEFMRIAKQAGIAFDSATSEISDANYALLREYLSKKQAKKTNKTLSIGTGGMKGSLPLSPTNNAAGPHVVLKRSITKTSNTDAINRQLLQREKATLEAQKTEPAEKANTGAPKQTESSKKAADTSVAKKVSSPSGAPHPYTRGRVPQIKMLDKPTSSSAAGRSAQNKITAVKPQETKTPPSKNKLPRAAAAANELANNKQLNTATKATDNNKPRKGRFSGTSRQKKREGEGLQLNEFQRRKDEGRSQESTEPLQSSMLNQAFSMPSSKETGTIEIDEQVQVGIFAHQMGIKANELIKELMKLKVMATLNQSIDFDTAEVVADHFGFSLERKNQIDLKQLAVTDTNKTELSLDSRPPVITVMGHVDHGKTSLLDYIRRSKVVEGESGGITQHIGAYHVTTDKGGITFLDTPGHAAFTAMRARGAQVTDIIILVIAADDKVMPQTIEAIQHARSAKVPIVVALNKIDKPAADPDRIMNDLSSHELVPESWGGDTQFINVSAHSGEGIDKLLEAVLLQAEILELKAPTSGQSHGVVVESWLDKSRGPLATVLVDNGTLSNGTYVLAGTAFGRIRAMFDELGKRISSAGPSMPVKILGLSEVPEAGDELLEVANERAARELVSQRQQQRKLDSQPLRVAANPFSDDQAAKVLPLILKADTQGSVGAILHALAELENDKLELKIVLSGVGGITESDAGIAHATGSRIVGFNVRADKTATSYCEKEGVNLKYYSIIYELIEEIDNAMHGLLDPIIEEQIVGVAEVRDVFAVSKFGKIAGCMVVDGTVHRNKSIRVLRDNVVIYQGELESLRRFKDDAREVRSGMECGIGVKNYKDVKAGDKIEVFDRIEKRPSKRNKN